MFNLVNVIIVVMVVAIIVIIVKAVRRTKEDIDERLKGVDPAKRSEFARTLVEKMRAQDVRCTRCGKQAAIQGNLSNDSLRASSPFSPS